MRILSGLLVALVLLLTGCGSDGPEDAEGRAPESPSSGTSVPEESEPELLTLVAQSAVGGEVDPTAVSLDGPAAVAAFTDRFEDGRMREALDEALAELEAEVPEGQVPAGAVVAVGCVSPTEVHIEVTDDAVLVTAAPVKSDIQCLVAVTTVAVVAVDPDDL